MTPPAAVEEARWNKNAVVLVEEFDVRSAVIGLVAQDESRTKLW